ncbi:hypothetical protein [Limnobacter sp.]|uniref:hypothetical protein n=1 Tax=Limnobacter sp. TaxID=2003368 RepID=UPI002FE1F07D
MSRIANLIRFTLFACLFACLSETPGSHWITLKDLKIYTAVNSDQYFTVKSGTACSKGDFSYGKVDRYLEVERNGKRGWLLEDSLLTEQKEQPK